MNESHCTPDELHALIDGILPSDDAERASAHMRECAACDSRYRFLLRFDGAVKRLPLTPAGRGFTDGVMAKLDSSFPSPRAFRFFTWIAYQFGMLIVAGVMLGVFTATGLILPEQIEAGKGVAGEGLALLDALVVRVAGGLSGWVNAALLPVSAGTLAIFSATGLVLLTLLLIDRNFTKKSLN
jgi:anti-sigma factor RsiW